MLAYGIVIKTTGHIECKSMGEEYPRLRFADAPRPQVKQRFVIKLADGAAVAAFHVVCENLQLRLGVYRRLLADEQVVVLLEGVGLLCIEAHEYLAIEHGGGGILRNILIPLVAFAMRFHVVHDGVVIHQLVSCRKRDALQVAFHLAVAQSNVDVVSHECCTGKRAIVIVIQAVFFLVHFRVVDVTALFAGHL